MSTANVVGSGGGEYEAIPDVEAALLNGGDVDDVFSDDDDDDDAMAALLLLEEEEEEPSSSGSDEQQQQQRGLLLETKYPEATNSLEAKLLATLDNIIDFPTPEIALRPIQPKHINAIIMMMRSNGDDDDGVGTSSDDDNETTASRPPPSSSSSIQEFLQSIKIPNVSFVATLGVAITILMTEVKETASTSAATSTTATSGSSDKLRKLFPYVACLIGFVGIVPPLLYRCMKRFKLVYRIIDRTESRIYNQVDKVCNRVENLMNQLQEKINIVLQPIQSKTKKLSKAETMINKVLKEDIDIPDPDDLTTMLEGCSTEIQTKMDTIKSMINVRDHIPICMRSYQNLQYYVVYPILFIFLAIQIYSVYKSSSSDNDDEEQPNVDVISQDGNHQLLTQTRHILVRSLRQSSSSSGSIVVVVGGGRYLQATEVVVGAENDTGSNGSDNNNIFSSEYYLPIWISIQVYVTAIVQLMLIFALTSTVALCAVLNQIIITPINKETRDVVERSGAKDVFELYLTTKMQLLKDKLTKILSKIKKIETSLEKFGLDLDDLDDLSGISSFDDLKAKAKAKLSKLTSGSGGAAAAATAEAAASAVADKAKDKFDDAKKNIFGKWGSKKKKNKNKT